MIKDYQLLLDEVKNTVLPMGFMLIKNDDFEAVFSNDNGWLISFEGERYVRPAFDLVVGINDLSFSTRLLMEVFDVNEKPSLTAQLDFIAKNYKNIFVFPPPYAKAYEKLNEVDI